MVEKSLVDLKAPAMESVISEYEQIVGGLEDVSFQLERIKKRRINHIVVLFPRGSKRKLKALSYAIVFAEKFGSKITVFYEPNLLIKAKKFMNSVTKRARNLASTLRIVIHFRMMPDKLELKKHWVLIVPSDSRRFDYTTLPRPLMIV